MILADRDEAALHHENHETDFKRHVRNDEREHAWVKNWGETAEKCKYAHEGDGHENVWRHYGNIDAHVVEALHFAAPRRAVNADGDERSENCRNEGTDDC